MVVGGCAGEHSDAVHSVFNDLKALAAGLQKIHADKLQLASAGTQREPGAEKCPVLADRTLHWVCHREV